MNERVQELSEQAEKYAADNFRGEPTWSEAFESKFAELIIRECIVRIDSCRPSHSDDHLFNTYMYGTEWGYILAIKEIKRHFGIEK